jgi:hypothetical protein
MKKADSVFEMLDRMIAAIRMNTGDQPETLTISEQAHFRMKRYDPATRKDVLPLTYRGIPLNVT